MQREIIKFEAELCFQGAKIKCVSCEITVPELPNEKVSIEAKFHQSEATFESFLALPSEFSLKSLPSEFHRRCEISVNEAYALKTTSHGDLKYITLEAKAIDLKVRHIISSLDDEILEVKKNVKNFHFLLTQSINLSPVCIIEYSFDGNTVIKNLRNESIEIRDGLELKFVNYYFNYSDPHKKNKHISESVLAAELSNFTEEKTDEDLFSDIDLFLKI